MAFANGPQPLVPSAQIYPTPSATLRPAGFGWQATRNRILGEGGSSREQRMFYVYLMHREAFSDQRYEGFTTDLKSA